MDTYLHTFIAVACIAAAFYIGMFFSKQNLIENIVSHLLDSLEKDGFIRTTIDKDGDKTIIPISEIELSIYQERIQNDKSI